MRCNDERAIVVAEGRTCAIVLLSTNIGFAPGGGCRPRCAHASAMYLPGRVGIADGHPSVGSRSSGSSSTWPCYSIRRSQASNINRRVVGLGNPELLALEVWAALRVLWARRESL